MWNTMWDFIRQLTFENHIQPHIDIANILLTILVGIASIVAVKEYSSHKRQSKEADAREKRMIDTERAISRTTFARELYRDYLKTALDNPDLSIAQYDKTNKLVADKYDTFVSIMLYAFDEMIVGGQDLLAFWKPIIEGQVEVHVDYLEELFGKDAKGDYGYAYTDTLVNIIRNKLDSLREESDHKRKLN